MQGDALVTGDHVNQRRSVDRVSALHIIPGALAATRGMAPLVRRVGTGAKCTVGGVSPRRKSGRRSLQPN